MFSESCLIGQFCWLGFTLLSRFGFLDSVCLFGFACKDVLGSDFLSQVYLVSLDKSGFLSQFC